MQSNTVLIHNGTECIREHFVDVFFIYEFSCFHWNFHDAPLDGILEIHGHYFIYSNEKFPLWEMNGKKDIDGDDDYSYYTGKYELKPISKWRAFFHIIQHCWFKFCVYNKGCREIRNKNCPKIIRFFDNLARKKPDWVHEITSKKLYEGGTYSSYYETRNSKII